MEPRCLPEPDDRLARFRVAEPLAVRACLRALRDQGAPLTLHASPAPRDACAIGRLVAVNMPIDRIEIAADAQADSLRALARTRQATVVAFADRIKIQFVASGLECVTGDDGCPRLRALLPQVLYRVQRRDTFRVRPALRAHCALPRADGGTLALAIVDASIGGVSLRWPAAAVPVPVVGQRLEDCMVSLPGVATFRCDLLVRSVGAAAAGAADRLAGVRAEPGGRALRVGCAFESLSPPMQRTLQRFVFDTDKRQLMRARAGGCA